MHGLRRGVILVTGMPGSGKDEFVKVCISRGLRVVRMGDLVRAESMRAGLEMTDEKIGSIAQSMREEHGFDIWARKTIEQVGDGFAVVDGLRGRAEVLLFRKQFGDNAVVVAVHASPMTRFRRLVARARPDAPKDLEEFERRDVRELRWGLGDVISRADYVIVNEGSLEELNAATGAVLNEILNKLKG